jgi:hypothetical protein
MLSTCPKCQKQVSIPAGVEGGAVVRCPLCKVEYPLREALALAPPELIVVADVPSAAKQPEIAADADGENEAAAMAQELPAMPAAARFRSRRHKSFLHTVIEVILGGVAGIVVAYYGLALFYRSDFHRLGLPQLPLPFIQWITGPPAPTHKGSHAGEWPGLPLRTKPRTVQVSVCRAPSPVAPGPSATTGRGFTREAIPPR